MSHQSTCRNFLFDKDRYYSSFADSVYNEFRRIRYGIKSCKKDPTALYLDTMRKDLVDYQSNDDAGALTEVSIQHMGWLPVYYPTTDTSVDYCPPWADMNKYKIRSCSRPTSSIGMSYVGQNISSNLIEVNAGGCITRININPAININNYNNSSFEFIQNCADPQAIWYINHNLNIVPNVWAEDCNGDNISGVVDVVDNDTITLTFSSPVAGKAFLS
jgi:hypothetical protein